MINLDSISAFCRHLGWTVNESGYAITFTKTETIPNSICSVSYQIDAPNSPQGVIDTFDKEGETFDKNAVIMNALKAAEEASSGVLPISEITEAAERIQRSVENIDYGLWRTTEDENLQKVIDAAQQVGLCAYLSPNERTECGYCDLYGYYGEMYSECVFLEYGGKSVRTIYDLASNNNIRDFKRDLKRCMRKEKDDGFKGRLKELLCAF